MVTAILIVFNYDSKEAGINAQNDITTVQNYCTERKWTTKVLTDLEYPNAVKITTKEQFYTALTELLTTVTGQLFFYFSGHGLTDSINLPDKTNASLLELRDLICKIVSPDIPLLIMLDCCYASHLNLPYIWSTKDDRFRLRDNFTPQAHKISLLCSNSPTELSLATKTYSLFTNALLRSSYQRPLKYQDIITQLSNTKPYSQIIQVYSSFPEETELWSWFV